MVLSSNKTSQQLFYDAKFDLRNYASLLEKISTEKIALHGAKVIDNLATIEDLDTALKGVAEEDEKSIEFFTHLVDVERLLQPLIDRDPIALLIKTINSILKKQPIKVKAVSDCINAVTKIFKAHKPSIEKFFELNGIDTFATAIKSEEPRIVASLLMNLDVAISHGPADTCDKIIEKKMVAQLQNYWKNLGDKQEESKKKVDRFGGMKFINQCLAEGVTNEPKKLAFEEWKDMADLTDAGFKLFAAIANIDEECFDKVDRKFIESSMKLLTGYPTRRIAQTQAMNFFSNLDLKEV